MHVCNLKDALSRLQESSQFTQECLTRLLLPPSLGAAARRSSSDTPIAVRRPNAQSWAWASTPQICTVRSSLAEANMCGLAGFQLTCTSMLPGGVGRAQKS